MAKKLTDSEAAAKWREQQAKVDAYGARYNARLKLMVALLDANKIVITREMEDKVIKKMDDGVTAASAARLIVADMKTVVKKA